MCCSESFNTVFANRLQRLEQSGSLAVRFQGHSGTANRGLSSNYYCSPVLVPLQRSRQTLLLLSSPPVYVGVSCARRA